MKNSLNCTMMKMTLLSGNRSWLYYPLMGICCFIVSLLSAFYGVISGIDTSLVGIGLLCFSRHWEELKEDKKYSFKWKYYGRI